MKKKKKMIANAVMVCVILLVAFAGIFYALRVRGKFDEPSETSSYLTDPRGAVSVERDSSAFIVSEDTVLRKGDVIVTDPWSGARISLGKGYIALGKDTELRVSDPGADSLRAQITRGEIFVNPDSDVLIDFAGKQAVVSGSVASISVRTGASSVSVYSGKVGNASAGQTEEWLRDESSVRECTLESLNDFNIAELRRALSDKDLCFTSEQLDVLEAERLKEASSLKGGGTPGKKRILPKTPEDKDQNGDRIATGSEMSPEGSQKTGYSEKDQTEDPEATYEITEEIDVLVGPSKINEGSHKPSGEETENTVSSDGTVIDEDGIVTEKDPAAPEVTEPAEAAPDGSEDISDDRTVSPDEDALICTLTIRCDTILDNMDKLEAAKRPFIPESGCVLPPVEVEFEKGDSVFDVLKFLCDEYGISLEYSYTPVYKSYYVEGINRIYEFDLGDESGWVFKVNGWFPNYGSSEYKLTGGESIVWYYTCSDLGTDVGATW